MSTIHASAVCAAGVGILVRGASGSGKSSLVLALLDRDPEARLVADDRVALSVEDGRLIAAPPATIAGKLEIRGLGIVELPYLAEVEIGLVVDLLPPPECPRMPEAEDREAVIAGVVVPRLKLPVGLADAPARIRAALALVAAPAGTAKPLALHKRSVKIARSRRTGVRGKGAPARRHRRGTRG